MPDPTDSAKLAMAALMGLTWLGVWIWAWRQPGIRSTLRAAAVPFMAYIVLTPTVHPWYILILLAFLPFLPPGKEEPREPLVRHSPLVVSKRVSDLLILDLYRPERISRTAVGPKYGMGPDPGITAGFLSAVLSKMGPSAPKFTVANLIRSTPHFLYLIPGQSRTRSLEATEYLCPWSWGTFAPIAASTRTPIMNPAGIAIYTSKRWCSRLDHAYIPNCSTFREEKWPTSKIQGAC